jgi:hypothetical protein
LPVDVLARDREGGVLAQPDDVRDLTPDVVGVAQTPGPAKRRAASAAPAVERKSQAEEGRIPAGVCFLGGKTRPGRSGANAQIPFGTNALASLRWRSRRAQSRR